MSNGCPKCEKKRKEAKWLNMDEKENLCIDCQIEQAEIDVLRDMEIVEKLKKRKEQEHAQL